MTLRSASAVYSVLQTSRLGLFDRDVPLYSEARVLPPSKLFGASVTDSLVGDGCRIAERSVVKRSVIGSCAYIEEDCYVKVGSLGSAILVGSMCLLAVLMQG